MKKVFIIAGEQSGDLLGAKFMKAIKSILGDCEFVGVGGVKMEAEGIKSLFPINDINVMGFFEVLPKIFRINRRIKETILSIKKEQPDIILTIDSPGFCFRVVKAIQNLKIKKVHLIAPSVWAWKSGRAKKVAELYDLLLCILPFEPPYFEKYGLKSVFIGHPIFDDVKGVVRNIDEKRKIILTPGSRIGEIKRHYPIMLESVKILREYFKLSVFVFATNITKNYLESYNANAQIVLDEVEKREIMKSTSFVIAKSGTNAFEFNIYGIPMVIMYTMNFLTNSLARILLKIKFVNLVNIIADREIIPEFLGNKAKPKLIAHKVKELLENKELSEKQIIETKEQMKVLGYNFGVSASEKGANEIIRLL
ncbi:MAG: lipid-A-disaccharide synthase [Rickettsiales bacterium]|jgi:lipid-A-disaccharide synthase|nr:lipid-A-disaccharide synthase [Rickettsiales bacterium]